MIINKLQTQIKKEEFSTWIREREQYPNVPNVPVGTAAAPDSLSFVTDCLPLVL